MKEKFRKTVLAAVGKKRGITVEEILDNTPQEHRQEVKDTIDTLESENIISVDLLRKCTLRRQTPDGPNYTDEVSEKVYLKYSDVIGQFCKCPTYGEVLDFLGRQGVAVVIYRMTQWWRLALRDSGDGRLIDDIRGEETDRKRTWKEAADAAILLGLGKVDK